MRSTALSTLHYSSETEVFLHAESDVLDDAGVFLAFMGAAVWESCRRVYQPTQICFLTQRSASRLSERKQEREFQRLDRPRLILELRTLPDEIKPLQQLKRWKNRHLPY